MNDLQYSLEDITEGERLKEQGMDRAANSKQLFLKTVQMTAQVIARKHGEITVDDVHRYYWQQYGIDLSERLGNAIGSIFRGKAWEFTGRFELSKRPSRHRNAIRVWRLK